MRSPSHPTLENLSLARVLYALSDPVRLSLVQSLATKGEQACGALNLTVAKSTASHHFRVLREAGVIRMRPEGTQFINSLRKDDLDRRFPGLLDAVLHASRPL
ncbi:ArsR/SmtB family transcription factor [Roseateles sp. BYS180W]|uniref:ArsR/SmtB family transcription factor n=1 Tax=Roseateles rivi TaxID=3299028 RepID=A0ABW7FSN8_9BURK